MVPLPDRLDNPAEEEKITVEAVSGSDNATRFASQLIASAANTIDCCVENPAADGGEGALLLGQLSQRKRHAAGLRARVITEISADNLALCVELMKDTELYHLTGIKGSFLIADGARYCHYNNHYHHRNPVKGDTKRPELQLVAVNGASFAESQQFLFESLLSRAIPAKERIKEIEKGVEREFIETIHDPQEMLKLASSMVGSAKYEVLALFSTVNAFYRAEGAGLTEALGEASRRGVKVRALIKIDDDMTKEASKKKIKEKHEQINVQFIRQSVRTRITVLVVDQVFSLAMEVNDDSKDTFAEATGLATYSNSSSTVYSNVSMFESLWIQSEIEWHKRVKHAYFQIFRDNKLKDEVYDRKWSSEQDGG